MASASAPAVGEWIQLTAPDGSYVRGKVISCRPAPRQPTVGWRDQARHPPAALAVIVYRGRHQRDQCGHAGWVATILVPAASPSATRPTAVPRGSQDQSETNTNLPRMTRGPRQLFAVECPANAGSALGDASNDNDPSNSGLMAYPDAPSQSSQGLDSAGKGSTTGKGDYFVRTRSAVRPARNRTLQAVPERQLQAGRRAAEFRRDPTGSGSA